MINYKDVHIIFIGYAKTVSQYYVNLDIYRKNFSFGNDLHITTVYNDDLNQIISGMGENNFIAAEDGGYATGALNAINEGLEFAKKIDRNIVLIHNFDCMFFSEEGFNRCIREFLESEQHFSAAVDGNGLPATDIMIFKKEFLDDIIPIEQKYCKYREHLEIAERYKNTKLGFENCEEWVFNALINHANKIWPTLEVLPVDSKLTSKENPIGVNYDGWDNTYKRFLLNNIWHGMSRFDLPRLYWSNELTLGHIHSLEEVYARLLQFKMIKGNFINHIFPSLSSAV